ncbi:PTS system, Fru family, IIC component [Rubrobacter radiotolerans]|uniref:Fructose-specific PTS transporter subunit EIIC n=1 Tax=Rubrobacter radiotolerans TaxID=42256 RepID=A0A023X407_RUBRA|nr:fructose-specific PTS transporter subunit EIIC [Rubrobacter radiotolerans]AHY46936.1 PTS system, Fru family, IIC component [Rubrobacter radiotolerans]MDX5894341.1 fructose-specific PTS transporter subunit EIIC [Rubrobacter radiotolerans]SMC05775.1 PTS system, fructose-specific IIC component [Rubrobacter radiotolerans DSM 5868]
MKFVGVTACPTGIAHSSMAAEAIEQAAKERGHDIEVEIHGAMGAEFVSPETIRDADAIIFATDANVAERNRFDGKPKVEVRLREAIDRPGEVVARAEKVAESGEGAAAGAASGTDDAGEEDDLLASGHGTSRAAEVRRWLMTGVSYMIPFVVAGGILIALAFAIGDTVGVTESNVYEEFSVPALVFEIGATAFSMLVPILAGFIAFAMADRPGIAPGVVGGLIANEIGAGFLGGLAAGLLAGAVVMLLKKIKVPGAFGKLMPIIVYPVVGTFVVGAVMILLIGEPIAGATTGMQNWLEGLSGANAAFLGLILGAMMAFDLGGPVNKTAYAFAIAGLAGGAFGPMAAVMAAGMVPPLALALACVVRPGLFTNSERRAGQANWLLGASFITEGAIPFAASDPLRVIPSMMAGSATAAALSLLFGATLQAPHGGIFVIGLIGNWPLYLLAIAIGTVVSALCVVALKQFTGGSDEKVVEEATGRSSEAQPAATTS